MNSLEIINERIKDLEDRLESAKYLANGNPSEFGKTVIDDLSKHLDSCKQIKQELEVLEILKNKKVDIGFVKSILESCSIEESLEVINDCGYRKLTMEELLKIKQWLGVN